MRSIKLTPTKLLILLTCQSSCLIAGSVALADETTNLRDQAPAVSSEVKETTTNKLATKTTTATAVTPATTKDATEEAIIRKTEPLPQFYFPY